MSIAMSSGALSGVRVVDCSGELGAYGARLFSWLGAQVLSVSLKGIDLHPATPGQGIYFHNNQSLIILDPENQDDAAWLDRILDECDVFFDSSPKSALTRFGLSEEALRQRNPELVVTRVSAYGSDGPDACLPASDLTLLARSGLMWLAGEPGQSPVRPAGHQSVIATGLFAAIGALIALLHAGRTGQGQAVAVSALEVMASALENAVQYWDLEGTLRTRMGSAPREAGTGLFACSDGYVYMMAGRLSTPNGWESIVQWLVESGVPNAEAMQDPAWAQYSYRVRPEATALFCEVFGQFAASRKKNDLYEEGQKRGIVICPLNTPLDLLTDRQLQHRKFFVSVPSKQHGLEVHVPRGPFTMGSTPLALPAPCEEVNKHFTWRHPRQPSRPGQAKSQSLPLEDVLVVDFTWVGAGPYTTKILADHGAQVIKIESASRLDVLRNSPPFPQGKKGVNCSGYFANRNTSKKSITLNLATSEGKQIAKDLIAQADIVANSFSPGTMEKWGLGYDDCKRIKPDIIYLSMPMHATGGPHSHFSGFGSAIAALSGLFAATGHADQNPVGTGTNYPDHIPNPCHAAIGLLAALHVQRQHGVGQAIELSQVESTICALAPLLIDAQLHPPGAPYPLRMGNREPGLAPHGVYRCKGEDEWIAISCRSEQEWQSMAEKLPPHVKSNPDFTTLSDRLSHQKELDEAISEWTKGHWAKSLAIALQEVGVDASKVQHAQDVVDHDKQLKHLGHFVKLMHPEMGEALYDAPPFQLSLTPGRLRSSAPMLGQHTEEVIRTLLGMDSGTIASLKSKGVIT